VQVLGLARLFRNHHLLARNQIPIVVWLSRVQPEFLVKECPESSRRSVVVRRRNQKTLQMTVRQREVWMRGLEGSRRGWAGILRPATRALEYGAQRDRRRRGVLEQGPLADENLSGEGAAIRDGREAEAL